MDIAKSAAVKAFRKIITVGYQGFSLMSTPTERQFASGDHTQYTGPPQGLPTSLPK